MSSRLSGAIFRWEDHDLLPLVQAVEDSDMLRVQVYGFYHLATKVRPISHVRGGDTYGSVFLQLFEARESVRGLLDNPIVPIRTCRVSAQELIDVITTIVPEDWGVAAGKDQTAELDVLAVWKLQNALNAFETVLRAELALVDTYSVSKKGAYSTTDLIQAADLMFPEAIRANLTEQAKVDIRQAGRCLAFETAVGFQQVGTPAG